MHEVAAASAVTRERRAHVRLHVTVAVVFVLTAFVRFMADVGFHNDHFLYIAAGQQMTFGDLPSRDFVDPGTPLMYAASALAQLATGSALLGEAVLTAGMFGLAAALTVYGAFRVSGSLLLSLCVAAAGVALFPRGYHYPKLVLYAAGMLAIWRYIDRPSWQRALALSACVAVAFLFRHDHGVYLGAAGALAVAGARRGWPAAVRRTARYAALALLLLSPYLMWVETTTGLRAHIESGLAYSRAEADRTTLSRPTFDLQDPASRDNAGVWLFYVFHALPIAGLAIAFGRAARSDGEEDRMDAARLLPLALLALAVNTALLRDPLLSRLADVAVPVGLLAAWLIPRAWRWPGRGRALTRALTVTVIAASLPSIAAVGETREQLNRTALWTPPARWRAIVAERIATLRNPQHPTQLPTRTARGLMPVLEYIGRCTRDGDRVFVAGEAPELYVAAGRPFGGGQHVLRAGYFSTAADQQRIVLRLLSERVPMALILRGADAESAFPLVMKALDSQFEPVGEIQAHMEQIVEVRVNRGVMGRGVDTATGWPCFR